MLCMQAFFFLWNKKPVGEGISVSCPTLVVKGIVHILWNPPCLTETEQTTDETNFSRGCVLVTDAANVIERITSLT